MLAKALYPKNYSVVFSNENLQNTAANKFRTHREIGHAKLHRISEALAMPMCWNTELLARVIQPLPGANKEGNVKRVAIKIVALVLWILTIPIASLIFLIGIPVRMIEHRGRPAMCFIANVEATTHKLELSRDNPLHIRTHNVGFVKAPMSIAGDLRHPETRAKNIVKSVLDDPHQPDIIFFQETFHEGGRKILANGLKDAYPYIIHTVAPQISGFCSGAMVASKYPIESAQFDRMLHMLGPERASPRGIMKVRLQSTHGPICLYSVHTQALLGEARSKARFNQLEQIKRRLEEDARAEPGLKQVLMGDFNTSRLTAWGEDNMNPPNQAEADVLTRFDKFFDDLYLRDHDPLTGTRTEGAPKYLPSDNARMNQNLVEPSGSWYHGPFATPGILLSKQMRRDRKKHNRPAPQRVHAVALEKVTSWGTSRWHAKQPANTARFDYIVLPQGVNKLDGRAEIRRIAVPQGTQSAPSDHLPVDARIWLKL